MQGTFENVDWRSALTPGLDEETQRLRREHERRQMVRRIERERQRRRPGARPARRPKKAKPAADPAAAGGGPAPPAPPPADGKKTPSASGSSSSSSDHESSNSESPASDDTLCSTPDDSESGSDSSEKSSQSDSSGGKKNAGKKKAGKKPAGKKPAGKNKAAAATKPAGKKKAAKKKRDGDEGASDPHDTDSQGESDAPVKDRAGTPDYDFPKGQVGEAPMHAGLRGAPQPPALSFDTGGVRFYVIPGRHEARLGRFGHYLRPYRVSSEHITRPFPKTRALHIAEPDSRFLHMGSPGVRWNPLEAWTAPNTWGWVNPVVPHYYVDDESYTRLHIFTGVREKWKALAFPGPHGDRDPSLPPDPTYALEGRDFVRCPAPWQPAKYHEVGRDALEEALEAGERLDLAFARRMQGLMGAALAAVWDCLDPGFDPTERRGLLSQFLGSYSKEFYDQVRFDDDDDARAVVTEALQQHKAFCQEWVHKHYKCLTPLVIAPAEALVSQFYETFAGAMLPSYRLTVPQFARLMMRDPVLSPLFAGALYLQISNLDVTRSNRNPTYKQMSVISNTAIREQYRMMEGLSGKRTHIEDAVRALSTPHKFHFDPLVVDWHGIVGQLPESHTHFRRGVENMAMRFRQAPVGQAPWNAYRPGVD